MVITAQPSGEVLRDISPFELGFSEKDVCGRLGGCSDIVVDVHLVPREWIDAIGHDVDWAESEEELDGDEHVTTLCRRDAICTYRRDMFDKVCRVSFPFLEVEI